MGIADREAALAKLREFRDLLVTDERALRAGGRRTAQVPRLQPLVEQIARELDPERVQQLGGTWSNRGQRWTLGGAITATDRLIGILEHQEDYEQILGPTGPTLAGDRLHRWVWHAAADLWDGGHYDSAVHKAALAVEQQTQLKVRRLGFSGKKLYSGAFSTKAPTASQPRLRFPHISRTERPDDWISALEGAQHLGMGCAQGIRNPQAHPSDEITEQEALEQLAALSVLARWVDECDVDSVDDVAAGE